MAECLCRTGKLKSCRDVEVMEKVEVVKKSQSREKKVEVVNKSYRRVKKLIRNTRWHLLGSATIIGAWISCFDSHVTQGEIEGKTSECHHLPTERNISFVNCY